MSDLSIEQAALRRGRFEDRTLAILERCVTAVEKLDVLDDQREREIIALREQVAEQGDEILALSNSLQGLTNAFHSRTDHLA